MQPFNLDIEFTSTCELETLTMPEEAFKLVAGVKFADLKGAQEAGLKGSILSWCIPTYANNNNTVNILTK